MCKEREGRRERRGRRGDGRVLEERWKEEGVWEDQ